MKRARSLGASIVSKNNSSRRRLSHLAIGALSAAAACVTANNNVLAQTSLWWDINGATTGSSANATVTGTWDSGTTAFNSSSFGTNATQAWTPGSIALFSAGT